MHWPEHRINLLVKFLNFFLYIYIYLYMYQLLPNEGTHVEQIINKALQEGETRSVLITSP